ncbi:ATP-dependent DNA ligase [Aquincola sp. S2]|uniref:Probable DNA ligase n=1 Tax=Pseudaquabacterium terrae TaxID=2732868 RepID=A0ABX2EAA0_9BURK|nr:ATP-dependent DNA ligase [Aquabacterium terrae]NRF65760.1 ATP-dependent DNA ligase [Aquabacterium terrae]
MPTPLAAVVDASRRAAETSSRIAKRDAIAGCLRGAAGDEVEIAVAFLSGVIRQGRIGLGYATLAAQRGEPAAQAALMLLEVDAALGRIAATSGKGSAAARHAQLHELFQRATAAEQDFLMRLLVGELRQGALEGVMIDAVAAASGVPLADVRRAAMFAGDVGMVARLALTEGAAALAGFGVALHRPLQPMLATPAEDIADAMARLGTAALEWKVDGARVQVHKSGERVEVYTRNLNDVTASVPEIVEAVQALPAQELVLDGEAVALNAGGTPLPFQVTMRRFGRKLDVARMRSELPLAVYFFDCLHRDVMPLIDRPARERFDALADVVPPALVIPRLITADVAAAEDFYADALARGHEGVMAKALDAPYEAGGRGASWLKVKRTHTLDLVVLAAEWGHGRRRGWLSNLHLGARDPAGGWVKLGKTFKGMTDALLEWQTAELLARESSRDAYTVYVRPELVVEIAFNDLQQSPQYPGGLALRFARVKGYRPDKRAEEADTIEAVRALYAAQGANEA